VSAPETKSPGFLSPVERFSEVLFGLIMTLSITGTLSVVSEGRQEVLATILGVLGCNIAWGIIDGVLYLMGAISDRGRGYKLYKFIQKTTEREKAHAVIAEAMPSIIAEHLSTDELEDMRRRITEIPEPPRRRLVSRQDIGGAVAVCFFVIFSCVPLIIPLLMIDDPRPALRLSNAVAIVMLFVGGYNYAKYSGLPKIWTGVVMVTLGAVMVGITIALGG